MYLEFYVLVVIMKLIFSRLLFFCIQYRLLYSMYYSSGLLANNINKNLKEPFIIFLCEMKGTFDWCESLIDIFLCHNVTYHTLDVMSDILVWYTIVCIYFIPGTYRNILHFLLMMI